MCSFIVRYVCLIVGLVFSCWWCMCSLCACSLLLFTVCVFGGTLCFLVVYECLCFVVWHVVLLAVFVRFVCAMFV